MDLVHILSGLDAPSDGRAEPRQLRLYRLLRDAILAGRLAPGFRLPASRVLAGDWGMARNSVLFAYGQLQAEGFIVADRQGSRVARLPIVESGRKPADNEGRRSASVLSDRGKQLISRDINPVLPFCLGMPDLNAFPWQIWARFLQQAWGEVSARQLSYGAPGGEPSLREGVASYLRVRRGVVCTPEQVFIVGGGQVALDACARLLADHGDTVWLENPCYPLARSVMQAAGLNLVHVPVDGEGMAPEDALWDTRPPRLMFLTPSHQFPLGSVLSLERRLEFLRRIQMGGGWIIEDDYDSDFRHHRQEAPPPTAMQGLDSHAPVVYVGTFSKILYPALRLAYMVLPTWAVAGIGEGIGALYRAGQAVEQRALARFLASGRLTTHLRTMATIYRRRQEILRQELESGFGAAGRIRGGEAGLHLTLELPEGPPDKTIVTKGAALGISLRALSAYYAVSGEGGVPQPRINGLVLGYGMAEEKMIPELTKRVVQAVRAAKG